MGQRHQIFVKILNPANNLSGERTYNPTPAEKRVFRKQFGSGKFAILAYHNQWLFGRGALQNALNLLNFGSQFSKELKSGKDSPTFESGYDVPFTEDGMKQKFSSVEKITDAIAFIMNFRATSTPWLTAGIGTSWYLGASEPEMNFDYTRGDNNDGVTIIDLVENKYCFMNINGYSDDEKRFSASDLPFLEPVDAKAYVTAYYGETIDTVNPYYLGDHDRSKITKTLKQQEKIVSDITKTNKKPLKGFEKFEVLTALEVSKMFKQVNVTKLLREKADRDNAEKAA